VRAVGRLPTYVVTCSLVGLAAALGVVSSITLLVGFVELSRAYGGRAGTGFLRVAELDLYQAPAVILLLMPFVFLFGIMSAFIAMNRRSELVAMRAAGISAWRFIFPAAALALVIGVINVTALNPMAAALTGHLEDVKADINSGDARGRRGEIWLRQGDEHTQVVIRAKSHEMADGAVRLHNVSLFLQNVTAGGALQFSRRIEATEARLDPGFWRLSDVREATPGAGSVRSETLSIPSTLDRRTALEGFAPKDAVGFWRLPDTIDRADDAGFSSAPYRLRFFQLLASPLLLAAMSVLGAAFSLRMARLGGLIGMGITGVALGFAAFFLDRLCGALGAAEVVPPVIAALVTPVVALLAGFTLLCYTEDG